MMRGHVAQLALSMACCLLALAGAVASGAAEAAPVSTQGWRTTTLELAPAPGDLALVEIGFRGTVGRQRISSSSLTLTVSSPFGADYLALAAFGRLPSRSPRALALIVNRPSPLLDPVSVRLRLRSSRALGAPVLRRLIDPFTHPHPGLTPALCDLPLHGARALGAWTLNPLRSRGSALSGFSPATALAQAYDLVCGAPYEPAFGQAIGHGAGACRPTGSLCCPPNALCATPPGAGAPTTTPTPPSPPGPVAPGCSPCGPAPGHACPQAVISVCAMHVASGRERAVNASH